MPEYVKTCTRGEWREILQRFRACIPAPEGWSWKIRRATRRTLRGDHGTCRRVGAMGRGGHVELTIADDMSYTETEDTLLHEAAHGYDRWDHHGWGGDHGDTFWLWLGRLTRRYRGQETG